MKFITIIGIGLIGSSIARIVKSIDSNDQINIIDNSKENLEQCRLLKLGNIFNSEINVKIEESDLIFVCTPISSYEQIFNILNKFELSKAIISDVGSSKVKVIELAEKILKNKIFVPGHPIAGTEKSGPQNGFENLFKDKWFISTSCNLCNEKNIEYINSVWQRFGSRTITMKPKAHDSIMAITSHIPHLIAYNIVGTASELEDDIKSEVIKFSASGFRDFTRIAGSNPIMWRDIFLNNREAVLEMLQRFSEDLTALQRAIRWGEAQTLEDLFTRTREIRRGVIDAKQEIPPSPDKAG